MITLPQAQYIGYKLTRCLPSNSVEKFSNTLLDSKVELNSHQIQAALFTFRSPLLGGAILADEVGLGKTIESSILISQNWAEGNRRVLILCPSSLRTQWANEIYDKFYFKSIILERNIYKREWNEGNRNPFEQDRIVIVSYHFANNKESHVEITIWELVVIDEAHRLSNSYKPNNVIGRTLLSALSVRYKLLLSATPLQNSIMDLYGLFSFIDILTFGDKRSFKSQFSNACEVNYTDLKERVSPLIHRTLRNQIKYLKFTRRYPLTFQFTPTKDEQKLYNHIIEYLQGEELSALPAELRHLLTLVMRKLLGSSRFAITKTLHSLINRLQSIIDDHPKNSMPLTEEWDKDYETLEEYIDESDSSEDLVTAALTDDEIELLKTDIKDLSTFHDLAEKSRTMEKGKS